jgi:hypothetical protein
MVDAEQDGACGGRGKYQLSIRGENSQKGADFCAQAISLGTLTAGGTIGDAAGNNRWNNFCATTAGDPDPVWKLAGVTTSPYQTVWFKFNTGSVGRSIRIDGYNDPHSWGDQIDLKLALYGGTCGALTLIDKDYDTPPWSETMEGEYCLQPNTDYYILVSGSNIEPATGSSREGYFGLTVKDNGPYPANDLVCGATTIPLQTAYTYNSAIFSNENNINGTNCFEPNPDWTAELGQDNDHGVWYYIGQVPGRTMVVDANSLAGDNIDIQMALYSSTVDKGSCTTPATTPTLTEVQKDYTIPSWDEDAYYNCLDPNKYYWLLVDGSDATGTGALSNLEQGNFSLRVWFPTEGSITFCNAQSIGTVPTGGFVELKNLSNICGTNTNTNMGVSPSSNVILPSEFSIDKAVIYKFVAPASGSVKVEAFSNPYYPGQMGLLTGDEIDIQLAVYEQSGGNCTTANFYPKANKYDPTDGFNEKMIVNCLNAGQTYYVMVDGSGLNTNGYFDLKISDYGISTPNDFLCNATTITGTMGAPWTNCNSNTVVTLTGQNNYCATITNDLPASLGGIPPTWGSATSGVWYKFKAPKSGKLKIEAKNSFPDYLPPYDEPEINIEMAVFRIPGGYNGTCANLSTEKDRLELVASEFDGLLHDEDFTVDCLMPDSIYYLLVDGSSNLVCPTCDRGEFYLTLTADPRDRPSTNDLPCDAIDLGTPAVWTNPTIYDTRVSPASGAATYSSPTTGYPSATGLHNGARNNAGSCMRAENNFCAGIAGEPAVNGGNFFTDFSPDATVWYKFTAPTTGEVKINTYNDPDSRGDQIYTQIAVFETSDNTCTGTMVGIAADGLPELNGNNELTVKCLDPGKTYFLMIDGAGVNIKGYFELQIQAVPATLTGPPNDDICNATPVTYPASIGVKTTLNNQTNRCATIQSGVYPSPTTFTTDADVWYTFTTAASPNNQAVKVEVTSGLPWPFGDAMDPQIALYKGSCPSSFTLVDDGYSALGLPFYESFEFHCLEPNTTYYLMVDGSGLNEQGNFKLDVTRISPHPLPTNDHICDVGISATNGYLGVLGGVTGNKIGSKNAGTEWHNFCSDVEPNENTLMTDGAYGLDQTVWFHFKTPNVANNVNVEIRALSDPNNVGDAIDLQMLLAQGNPTCPSANPFSSLTPIEAVDPALTFNATMDVCLPPNTDFYIQVDGSGLNTQGYFTLEIENMGTSSAPANDNICNAKVLPIGGVITGSYTGYLNDNNICATLEASEKQHIPGSIQRSVWYKFTTPTSADVSIEVKGNSWVPFSTNYFLPDITIWEVNDGTNTVGACGSVNWTKLDYNDSKYIPNSLANGVYPTVVLTPLCLKPNYTYFIQVDGTDGIGLDGYFDIRIKNNQPSYVGPSNNECGGATALTVGAKSCQISGGAWSTYNYGDPTWSRVPGGCTADCGDIWYKFTMPPACGNNTQSFVKVEGNDEMGALGVNNSQLAIAAYRGTCASMSYIKCSTGGVGVDPDFSISGTPGETIYLQVWDLNGDDFGKDFQLCISEQKSADDCVDATSMNLDVPYCFSVSSSGGETPNPSIPGSGLKTSCGAIDPVHSTYFKFTTDPTNTFCDDYYMYIKLEGLAKQIAGASLQNCSAGLTPSVEFSATVWEVKAGGTLCTPGPSNVTQRDCYKWNDCGTGSYGTNVSGPHGNGGVVNDTVWFNMGTGFAFQPNTTYYIVLDYEIKNALTFNGRYIEDGTIEIGRRCKGRVWEYTTASLITTNKYCTSSDGWRHYYDDKGTPSNTSDDKFIFSVYPNGNDFEGTATVHLEPTRYSYQDIPNDYAEYVMKRRWDYTLNFGSISPVKPVKIRFYYQTSEKQDIITAALNFKSLYGGAYEDFEWFKSTNGHVFNPLTDVNPRVISVGPNGYSEAGCLSWWNAAGVYIGPPGIKRCQDLSATDWEDNNTYQSCNGIHYVEYTGLTGFSGGTGGTGVSPWDISPLPVELVSFTGYNDGNKNVLNWTTASELNTLKFEVERKIPTTSSFEYIGEKPAAGNSNTPRIYTLEDINPAMGINYYRLKMIDIDGTFKYSNVIAISVLDIAQPQPDGIIAVYPNPTNNELNIVYQSKLANKVNLHVFNTLGQHMLSEGYNMHSGMNTITIKVTDFAKGMYILDMQNTTSGEKFQSKFIKD